MVLLTIDEAAERLSTTPRFIRRLVAERRIPYSKVGKFVRIASTDLDAFIAAGRVETTGPHTAHTRGPARLELSGRPGTVRPTSS